MIDPRKTPGGGGAPEPTRLPPSLGLKGGSRYTDPPTFNPTKPIGGRRRKQWEIASAPSVVCAPAECPHRPDGPGPSLIASPPSSGRVLNLSQVTLQFQVPANAPGARLRKEGSPAPPKPPGIIPLGPASSLCGGLRDSREAYGNPNANTWDQERSNEERGHPPQPTGGTKQSRIQVPGSCIREDVGYLVHPPCMFPRWHGPPLTPPSRKRGWGGAQRKM